MKTVSKVHKINVTILCHMIDVTLRYFNDSRSDCPKVIKHMSGVFKSYCIEHDCLVSVLPFLKTILVWLVS